MINEIIDMILEFVKKHALAFDEYEKRKIRLELYQNAERLFVLNPDLFNKETLELLDVNVPMLETEACKIRMECAQIWHKNSFDVWIFRIRFYLNISVKSDFVLLRNRMKNAFSYKSKNFMDIHDTRVGYERLIYQVSKSEAPEDQNIKMAIRNMFTKELVCDVDGVLTYVMLKEEEKSKKDIPSYMKTIYTAVTNISVIEGDGLCGWLLENNIRTLRSVCVALKKIGLKDASNIMSELYEYINENFEDKTFDEVSDPIIQRQIEIFENRLMKCINGEMLVSFAEVYLQNCINNDKTHV